MEIILHLNLAKNGDAVYQTCQVQVKENFKRNVHHQYLYHKTRKAALIIQLKNKIKEQSKAEGNNRKKIMVRAETNAL